MAMARQFFETQKTAAPGPSFSPAQMAPMQGFLSRQLPHMSTNRSMPDFSDAWAEIQRAQGPPGLHQNTFSPAAWASEFNPVAFAPGPLVQQSATLANGAFALQFNNKTRYEVANSGAKPIFSWKCLRHSSKSFRS
jgi:hypothetical protein